MKLEVYSLLFFSEVGICWAEPLKVRCSCVTRARYKYRNVLCVCLQEMQMSNHFSAHKQTEEDKKAETQRDTYRAGGGGIFSKLWWGEKMSQLRAAALHFLQVSESSGVWCRDNDQCCVHITDGAQDYRPYTPVTLRSWKDTRRNGCCVSESGSALCREAEPLKTTFTDSDEKQLFCFMHSGRWPWEVNAL